MLCRHRLIRTDGSGDHSRRAMMCSIRSMNARANSLVTLDRSIVRRLGTPQEAKRLDAKSLSTSRRTWANSLQWGSFSFLNHVAGCGTAAVGPAGGNRKPFGGPCTCSVSVTSARLKFGHRIFHQLHFQHFRRAISTNRNEVFGLRPPQRFRGIVFLPVAL